MLLDLEIEISKKSNYCVKKSTHSNFIFRTYDAHELLV